MNVEKLASLSVSQLIAHAAREANLEKTQQSEHSTVDKDKASSLVANSSKPMKASLFASSAKAVLKASREDVLTKLTFMLEGMYNSGNPQAKERACEAIAAITKKAFEAEMTQGVA